MLAQALYNIVDSIFVARLGENALTAVSLAFPIQNLMISVGVGTGVGVNAFLSKSLGEKNFDRVNASAVNGIFLSWISWVLFMVLGLLASEAFFASQTDIPEIIDYGRDYMSIVSIFSLALFHQITLERLLSSTGKTFYSMISQLVGAITNIILDPILIFGLFGFPRMEVAGAAIATIVGQTAATLVGLYLNLSKNKEIRFFFKKFRPDMAIIKRIYAIGVPSILMAAMGSVMVYGINRILISFTATAAAVFGVYFKLQSFIFMPVFGLNSGIVPILAYNYGARNKGRIIQTFRLGVCYAVGIMLFGILLFQGFPRQLLTLFKATPEMMAIGIPALRSISLSFLFSGFCIAGVSAFQALGNGMESFVISLARQFVVLLPTAWLLSLSGSVNAIWWSFPIAELATLVMVAFFIRRLYFQKVLPLDNPLSKAAEINPAAG
jgi:putative MATE family efflux protein